MINLSQFMAVRTWKSSFCVAIFHHVLVLLLRYNSAWGTLPFNKLLSIGSYDFVAADKFGKNGWPLSWPLVLEFGSFSAIFWTRLAPWQKVGLATLHEKFSFIVTLLTSQSKNSTSQNENKWKFQWRKRRTVLVSQNNRMMSPSDAINLDCPCNSLFEFQVVNRYVFKWCNFV